MRLKPLKRLLSIGRLQCHECIHQSSVDKETKTNYITSTNHKVLYKWLSIIGQQQILQGRVHCSVYAPPDLIAGGGPYCTLWSLRYCSWDTSVKRTIPKIDKVADRVLGWVDAPEDILNVAIDKNANRLQIDLLSATIFADLINSCKELLFFGLINILERMFLGADIWMPGKILALRLVAAV